MKLILASDQSKFLETTAELLELNSGERFKNSLKKFSLFFLMAVGFLFVPVLHFFLVPLFLLLSLIFGFKAYAIRYRFFVRSACNCIECQNVLRPEYLLDQSMRLKCDQCSASYIIAGL
jgi:hypothetical protein